MLLVQGTDINVNITPTGDFNDQHWKITPLINGFYRLTTQWLGDDSSLDILNDNQLNDQIILAPTGNYSGQYWKISPTDEDGFYRLTTQWQGNIKSLSVVDDTRDNIKVLLTTSGNYTAQYWKITKI